MLKVKSERRTGYVIDLYMSNSGDAAEIYANDHLQNRIYGPNALDRAMSQWDRTVDYLDSLMELPEYKKGLKKI